MNRTYHPLRSLQEGHWFKLICGASFQHLPAIRNLALACTLAGVDCIDVAADPAVILAAWEGIQAAQALLEKAWDRGFTAYGSPWLMVSLNDGEDPHFRKAQFDPTTCPPDCPRPCEAICPTQAINLGNNPSGIAAERCYGCGRCVPICPHDRISTRSYVTPVVAIAPLVLEGVDALEIHTQPGRLAEFQRLWQAILPWVSKLKLIAVSCPDGEGMVEYLRSLYEMMAPLPCPLIWQTDGRPMSGDIGDGTTHAAIKLGQAVLSANLPGYVQLAGGTNGYTVTKLRELGLLNSRLDDPAPNPCTLHSKRSTKDKGQGIKDDGQSQSSTHIAGIAYGSYLRSLLSPIFDRLNTLKIDHMNYNPELQKHRWSSTIQAEPLLKSALFHLETDPHLLWQAVGCAHSLVSQLKGW